MQENLHILHRIGFELLLLRRNVVLLHMDVTALFACYNASSMVLRAHSMGCGCEIIVLGRYCVR